MGVVPDKVEAKKIPSVNGGELLARSKINKITSQEQVQQQL
jgi:hypothetical protein